MNTPHELWLIGDTPTGLLLDPVDAPVLLQKPFPRDELVGAIQRVRGLNSSLALNYG